MPSGSSSKHNRKFINKQQDTKQKEQETSTKQIDDIILTQAHPVDHDADQPKKRWYHGVPWWKVLKGAGIVAVLVYAWITYCQWTDAGHNFTVDERAWVSIEISSTADMVEGRNIGISVTMTNSGKTPARNVRGKMFSYLLKQGELPDFARLDRAYPMIKFGGKIVFPNKPSTLTASPALLDFSKGGEHPWRGLIIADKNVIDGINGGRYLIVTHGSLRYRDIFAQEHWLRFCQYTGVWVATQGTPTACEDYNDTDSGE